MNLFLLIYHNGGLTHHYFHGLSRAVAHLILTDIDAALLRFSHTHTVDGVPCGTYHCCFTVCYGFFHGRYEIIRFVGITIAQIIEVEIVKASPIVRNLTSLANPQYRLFALFYTETEVAFVGSVFKGKLCTGNLIDNTMV